jgi:hypothetical protein
MHRSSLGISVAVVGLLGGMCAFPACSASSSTFANGGGSGGAGGGGSGSAPNLLGGSSGGAGGTGDVLPDGGIVCPTGLQCGVTCQNGGSTTVSGKVYDPAGKNPLYNVAVYVPATPLQPLPKGVPTGADACSCGALFESGAVTSTSTAVDGTFTLSNVPVGSQVPLVLQIGKWRHQVTIDVNSCTNNAQPDGSLALPGTIAAGDTNDNMPDIAVSTGSADSLECLMLRIGIPASEYVAGGGATGHVHVFSGGDPAAGKKGNNGNGAGTPEKNPMAGAPESDTSLWDSQADLMPYDILLLSCEGGETYNASPANLEAYLNAGGRAFASHYHYAWFAGPLGTGQGYSAPGDWGNSLATWTSGGGTDDGPIGGTIDQTLNAGGGAFQKGQLLSQWLGDVGGLGQDGVPAAELSIYSPRYNAVVGATNTPSQPWIIADSSSGNAGETMYFSFDTPVNAAVPTGGTAPAYCGRAVFSDLHVAGNPSTNDKSPPPNGCDNTDLSPQEKALEFMLFDLSSCVIPDTVTVPPGGGVPSAPPK